jgi:signal transduction histidine kinase
MYPAPRPGTLTVMPRRLDRSPHGARARRAARSASRDGSAARALAAADAERRRLERDLHDGAQQRLVSLSLRLRLLGTRLAPGTEAEHMLAAAQDELAASLRELRELAHGLHPAVLSERGLAAALGSVALRAPLPVELAVNLEERLPERIEVAAYYLVSEALTNVAEHAQAATAHVTVTREHARVVVEVADDGVGGADLAGSGLRGLADRVAVLGGELRVSSPCAGGTRLRAEFPSRILGLWPGRWPDRAATLSASPAGQDGPPRSGRARSDSVILPEHGQPGPTQA